MPVFHNFIDRCEFTEKPCLAGISIQAENAIEYESKTFPHPLTCANFFLWYSWRELISLSRFTSLLLRKLKSSEAVKPSKNVCKANAKAYVTIYNEKFSSSKEKVFLVKEIFPHLCCPWWGEKYVDEEFLCNWNFDDDFMVVE